MHEIYELKEMLMNELEEYGRKQDLSTGSLEVIDKLAHTIKNLCKIIEAAEDEEGGSSYAGGGGGGGSSYRSSYARGGGGGGRSNRGGGSSSYEGGGGNMGGGSSSYARGRGRNARRDSMGRYSSERGYSGDPEEMVEQLRSLMEEAPDEMIRKDIEKLLRKVEQQM